jgi:cellulose biosynthesis protein BcsQ
MHVATFYSFKGGSGRSMALINVAAELAKSGQRVLVVDFDLEAPGLDTFNLAGPPIPTEGVVDFVLEYLKTGSSPDFTSYCYKSEVKGIEGELWVMPSGRNDESYDQRFKSINWRELYQLKDGYLLFEDLKAQWKDSLNPDYVLIDSRTGHTDMSGICTRQLPDAVFLFIFPTEQNRRGLQTIVEKIRHEAETERKKDIKLHLVFANMPDLDDEESYIEDSIGKVQESLHFAAPSAVIHHYPSAFLLTQPIFALERPKTKLAQEYQQLTRVVRRDNLKDRFVALEFIENLHHRPSARKFDAEQLETRLVEIENEHRDDAEVRTKLALLYQRLRKTDTALKILEETGEDIKTVGSEFYLTRANLLMNAEQRDFAFQDFLRVLNTTDAGYIEVSAVARALLFNFPDSVEQIISTPAFERLETENKVYLTNELLQKEAGLVTAYNILYPLNKDRSLADPIRKGVRINLALTCIADQKFAEAAEVILWDGRNVDDLDLEDLFNYAMARWALDGEPSESLFAAFLRRPVNRETVGPNFHQCYSISLWVIGDREEALSRWKLALDGIQEKPFAEFSCWSYLYRSREEFIDDLAEMKKFYDGNIVEPRFISRH